MSISRRNFIKIGGVSAALLAGTGLGIEAAVFGKTVDAGSLNLPSEVYGDTLYRADTFKNLVGSEFNLQTENVAVTGVLTAIKENSFVSRGNIKGKKIEPAENFMLLFRVSSPELEQANYTMFHPELGTFDLLLVPSKNDKGENLLKAVINRL